MLSRMKNDFGFTREELAVFRNLSNPERIQHFLDEQLRLQQGTRGPDMPFAAPGSCGIVSRIASKERCCRRGVSRAWPESSDR